jgi:UDP-glucuronate 4-epimerase
VSEHKKYIVTGSAGFVGHHLCKDLLTEGHQVLGIDSMDSYYSVDLKEQRQSLLSGYSNYEFIKMNLSDSSLLDRIVSKYSPDSIFHMAAQAGVRLKKDEYGKYIESNLVSFSNIILAARNSRVSNFLYASSSSVYGNINASSFSEKSTDLEPISFYGATKLAGEILARSTFAKSNTKARGLRFFTVYGELGRPDMAYFKILNSLYSDTSFTVYGDGNDVRDFTYISDVIKAVRALDNELINHPEGFSDIVNIGGGNPRSLNEMIEMIEILAGKKIRRVHGEKSNVDVSKTVADFSYLYNLIGEAPKTKLEDGLKHFVNWGQSNKKLIV